MWYFISDWYWSFKKREEESWKSDNSDPHQVTNWSPAIGQQQIKKRSQAWDTGRTSKELSYWLLPQQRPSPCPSTPPLKGQPGNEHGWSWGERCRAEIQGEARRQWGNGPAPAGLCPTSYFFGQAGWVFTRGRWGDGGRGTPSRPRGP